jgi:tetratricopeptide (TPR) repeat protein
MKRIIFLFLFQLTIVGCAGFGSQSGSGNPDAAGTLDEALWDGMIAYKEGRLGEAETIFLKVLQEHPELSEAWFKLGNIYFRTGRYDAAVPAYEKTLYWDKTNGRAWYNLALCRIKQADLALKMGGVRIGKQDPQYRKIEELRSKLTERLK